MGGSSVAAFALLEIAQEFLGDFGKQRRSAAVFRVEFTHQLPPALVVVKAAQHREVAGQQGADVIEEQAPVDGHPPVFDVGGR